jgi:hypothetical protein
MSSLQNTLSHLVEHGFACLPLDQAKEAVYREQYFLAYKLITKKQDFNIIGLQIVLANLNEFKFYFPDALLLQKKIPDVALGFCGLTLIINGTSYSLRDLVQQDDLRSQR